MMAGKALQERKGEQIGGGFFVFRRNQETGRVASKNTLPFEHPTFEAARAEAERLTALLPGETFIVLRQMLQTNAVEKEIEND